MPLSERHDRTFRPDVEGLRAVAVGVVVLFHVGVPGFDGGYVGVDVFFVISGYVITRLLLRTAREGRPPAVGRFFADFYARRARRILPAAMLVVVVTVLAGYPLLGFIRGNQVADDARWIAIFLGNNHFANVGTDYFASSLPPSPLQNYWSLAVEEQFYVVFPVALLLLAHVQQHRSLRVKVAALSAAGFVVSFLWSIHYTTANGTAAYFAVTTRAWELALGCLVASTTTVWARCPAPAATAAGWLGAVGVVASVVTFGSDTRYPGWIALVPVGGAALMIAGGVSAPRFGPELVLGRAPLRWIGMLSYSIYLWHWPVLTLAEQDADHTLTTGNKLVLAAMSVILAVISFYLIENPIRRSRRLRRSAGWSIALGLFLILAVSVLANYDIHTYGRIRF